MTNKIWIVIVESGSSGRLMLSIICCNRVRMHSKTQIRVIWGVRVCGCYLCVRVCGCYLLYSLIICCVKWQCDVCLFACLKWSGCQYPSIAEEIKSVASADPANRKLFVRGLSWNTTSETLCAVSALLMLVLCLCLVDPLNTDL